MTWTFPRDLNINQQNIRLFCKFNSVFIIAMKPRDEVHFEIGDIVHFAIAQSTLNGFR